LCLQQTEWKNLITHRRQGIVLRYCLSNGRKTSPGLKTTLALPDKA
jgi:hypothetical protein